MPRYSEERKAAVLKKLLPLSMAIYSDPLEGADEYLDYHGVSLCIRTKTVLRQCSYILSITEAQQPQRTSWVIPLGKT
jgi:hypothetical protein